MNDDEPRGPHPPRPLALSPEARATIERSVRDILAALGEDPDRDGLRDTPRRVASMYAELFGGLGTEPDEVLGVTFGEDHREMVILRDIPFSSLCEHHLLPFRGVAHIGYIPNGRIVGLSKLARVVQIYARRPQVQERFTSQIADALEAELLPLGAGVIVEAEHTCMTIRGIRAPGAKMITSAMRGTFRENPSTRNEFLDLAADRPVR